MSSAEMYQKAKEMENRARALRIEAGKEAAKERQYVDKSKVLGSPEWMREAQLKQERQLQADRDRMAMLRHGADELVNHVFQNGSIYGAKLVSGNVDTKDIHGTITISLVLKPH